MLSDYDLRIAAIEKHQILMQRAEEARTTRKHRIELNQAIRSKIGRALIQLGQRLETQATIHQTQSTSHVPEA